MSETTPELTWMESRIQSRPNVYIRAAYHEGQARLYMKEHLGCSPKEIAKALGISQFQARRAFNKVRAEWRGR